MPNALTESGKARLRRLGEIRSGWLSPPNGSSWSSEVGNQISWTIPIHSAASWGSSESCCDGSNNLESKSTFDVPAGAFLVDEEKPFDTISVDYYVPHSTPAKFNRRKMEVSGTKTQCHPASTSMDIGLQLLRRAIREQSGSSWHLEESSVSYEATVSADLSLGQIPSFLDDISECLFFLLFPSPI